MKARRFYKNIGRKHLLDVTIMLLMQDMRHQISAGRLGPDKNSLNHDIIYQLIDRNIMDIKMVDGNPPYPELRIDPSNE